jgi:hypothetical protein
VNVADLRQLLTSVGQILTAAGSKNAAEIEYLNEKLKQFEGKTIKAFANLIADANRPVTVDAALATFKALFERALEPDVTEDFIHKEVKRYEKLTKPQWDDVAKQFGLEKKHPKKDQVIKAIAQRIIDRKGAFERSQV